MGRFLWLYLQQHQETFCVAWINAFHKTMIPPTHPCQMFSLISCSSLNESHSCSLQLHIFLSSRLLLDISSAIYMYGPFTIWVNNQCELECLNIIKNDYPCCELLYSVIANQMSLKKGSLAVAWELLPSFSGLFKKASHISFFSKFTLNNTVLVLVRLPTIWPILMRIMQSLGTTNIVQFTFKK